MPITIGANIFALRTIRSLETSQQGLSKVFERLSSGQRITRAADDAAGLAIADTLGVNRLVFTQGVRNLNDGVSLLNVADSAISNLSDITIRVRELATQASNGSLSNEQRDSLDAEAQALRDEFLRIAQSTEFNGQKLFDGSLGSGLRLQGGFGVDGGIFSSLGGALSTGAFEGLSVLTLGGTTAGESATGDLNGDGALDIVFDSGTDVMTLLNDGGGSFTEVNTIASGVTVQSIALGDVNGDDQLDVVVSGASGGANPVARVMTGDGSGSFTVGASYTYGTGVGQAYRAHLADLDGDGALDLLTAAGDFSGSNRIIFSAQLGNGDGTFGTANTLHSLPGAFGYHDISAGDLNGDGVLDVVSTYDGDVFVQIGNGDGTFQATTSYAVANAGLIDFADLNGDGFEDIVVGSAGGGAILTGDGSGGVSSTSSISTLTVSGLAIGDLNNDGAADLFFSGSTGGAGSAQAFLAGTTTGVNPLLEFSLRTMADARQALAPLEQKLSQLSEQRGILGAFQSRVSTAVNTLAASAENSAAAEARIRDTDVSADAAELTRLQILTQASSAILAQANVQPALAIRLISN